MANVFRGCKGRAGYGAQQNPSILGSSCTSFAVHAERIFTDVLKVPSRRGLAQRTAMGAVGSVVVVDIVGVVVVVGGIVGVVVVVVGLVSVVLVVVVGMVAVVVVLDGVRAQLASHPSPLIMLPSSHSSPSSTIKLPQP